MTLIEELKAKDQLIKEMANDKVNLEEENLLLRKNYDDILLNEANLLSKISSLEVHNQYLLTKYCQKRPPIVNSPSTLEMKKPEVNPNDDLSQRIDRLVKNYNK